MKQRAWSVLVLLAIASLAASAQDWTWMSGANYPNQTAVYGTQGTPASTNTPGARSSFMTWTDASGNLWLFGGEYCVGSAYKGDLWKYDPATQMWTWMKGSDASNQIGIYGTKGTPASTNAPGARKDAVSWTGADGMLWLFGGFGYDGASLGYLNDLWRYNPSTNQWTWISGSQYPNAFGNYGTQGVESATNMPGSRQYALSWTDADGSLWLFGGKAYIYYYSYYFNDLWKYNPATNMWTWMKGSIGTTSVPPGVYGTMGVPAMSNTPGYRITSTAWTGADGTLWLYGGDGQAATSGGTLDDLWKYIPATNMWTWMTGSANHISNPSYGTKGVSSPSNNPGSRTRFASMTDAYGDFWLFCGSGSYANDLWKYSPSTNEWTWMHGSNQQYQYGIYGTQGAPAPANTPGGRAYCKGWSSADGGIWLYGGYGKASASDGYLSDLWKYVPTPPPNAPPVADAGADHVSECGAQATLDASASTDPDNDALTYTWKEGTTTLYSGTAAVASANLVLGAHTLTLTVTDPLQHSDDDVVVITVEDHTAPAVLCRNIAVGLVNGAASITAGDIDNGTTDACSSFTLSVAPASFTCADIGAQVVTLTAVDAFNNSAACQATVTVQGQIPSPAITVTPSPTVAGHAPNTIFLGYGPQSVTLGASGGLAYSWSPSTWLSCTDCAAPVMSPEAEGSYTYTVTAVNDYGCTSTAQVTIDVLDWRCGTSLAKITICHNNNTICVAPEAVEAHLAHGDHIGGCMAPKEAAAPAAYFLGQNFPNPFNPTTAISYGVTDDLPVLLRVYDTQGRLLQELVNGVQEAGTHTVLFDGSSLPSGVYHCRLEAGGRVATRTMTLRK